MATQLLAGEWLALLPAPVAEVVSRESTNHTVIVVAWNGPATQPSNIALRCLDGPVMVAPDPPANGTKQVRITEDFRELGMRFWRLWQNPAPLHVAGNDNRRLDRALRHLVAGNLLFVREQTIEPWHVTVVVPAPAPFLPRSLRSRLQCAMVETKLDLREYRGRLRLLTADEATAQQVAGIVDGWRKMLLSFKDGATGNGLVGRLRQLVAQPPVEILSNQVIFEVTLPVELVVQAQRKLYRYAVTNGVLSATAPLPVRRPVPAAELRQLLAHEDEHVRATAVYNLGLVGDRSAAPVVRPLLEDRHPFVRAVAAEVLHRWGEKSIQPPAGFSAADFFAGPL